MAARDLWPGYTVPLVQTLRKCDLCLHLSGAARATLASASGQTWGYMAIRLPTYCLSPDGDGLRMQLVCLSPFCFQPLLCCLPADSRFSAQARNVALTVLGRSSCTTLPRTNHSTDVKSPCAVLETNKFR